jgi:undecaprenyl-diphosphatase
MGFHGSLHHMQPPGDLPVGQPTAEEGQYLPFPGGQGVDSGAGGGAPASQGARARRGEVRDDPGRDLR